MSIAEYAAANGLKRVGAREPFFSYLKHAWMRRDFAFTMAQFTNQAGLAGNRLGSWWLVLQPAIQAGVYGLIFGVLLGNSRPHNFIPFLFTGVFLFAFMQSAFQAGASSITGNFGLVRSLSFPRILLPANSTIQQIFSLLPQLGLLVATLLLTGQQITFSWLLLIPIVLLMIIFGFGVAALSARLTVQIQDLSKLIPFVTRIMFYVSGIFFSPDRVLHNWPIALKIAELNPVYVYISLARGVTISGYSATTQDWIAGVIWALVAVVWGTWFFWRAEERYGREL
ncbi:MAG: ABC transporter permease [Micrococcales bacterium]